MREILFRGKRYSQSDKDGDWIVGYYTGLDNGVYYIKSNTAEYYAVHGETLGQYTGLTDKNGVKIFEGDILKSSLGWKFVVEWDNENGRFIGFIIENERRICYVGREPKAEIIGNIHDNPELLEVTP